LSDVRVWKNGGNNGKECDMHVSEGNLERIFDNGKERVYSENEVEAVLLQAWSGQRVPGS